MNLATRISPRFLKRLTSALLLGPVALFLMVASKPTFLLVWFPALLLAAYEWAGIVRATPRQKILTAIIGLIYIPMAFYAMWALRIESGGWLLVLMLLMAVWGSDIGAYVAGKTIGGPKLIPSISPNKTWAGLAGAMIASAFMLNLCFFTIGIYEWSTFSFALPLVPSEGCDDVWSCGPRTLIGYLRGDWLWYTGLGLVLGLVCQIGDLFVSVFKRRAGLKDTGNLIPGHGGILDRIDSLMLAALFAFIYFQI